MSEFHTVMCCDSTPNATPIFLATDDDPHRRWSSEFSEAYEFASRDDARQAVQAQLETGNLHPGDRVTIQRFVNKYAGHITLTVGA